MKALKRIGAMLALLLLYGSAFAQQRYTLSGTLKDARNSETLINALVTVEGKPELGTITNEYGFYSLTLPAGYYSIIYSYVGYTADTVKLSLGQNIVKNVALKSQSRELKDVVVKQVKENNNITTAQMGVEKLNMAEINKLPVLLGERDVLKTIQLLPGIKSAGEGNSGFNVRGGTTDQNLILLDEAPVYNAAHLLGFFSTFNSDAIKDATIYKGTQPAQYGGRLASVLDIRMKDGNKQSYEANGSLGLISSKLSVEGPVVNDKGSFFVSGRRTYADIFLKASTDEGVKSSKLYFYDLNGKLNYQLGKKDRLYLSGYTGRDELGLGGIFGIKWGNATGTLRWNHILNDKLFSNTSLIYSKYEYRISIKSGTTNFDINSQIKDLNIKEEMQYFPNAKNAWKFGINSIYHTVLPGEVTSSGTGVNNISIQQRKSLENAIYANNDWKASSKLNINYGLRLSSFYVLGGGDFYELNENRTLKGKKYYAENEIVTAYYNAEPRISASFQFSEASSLKAGYARNTQNMHLISNSTSTNPTDKWVSNSNNILPEIADQVSLGYFKNLKNNKYELSAEAYYKNMQNQIDYKDGADVLFSDSLETQLLNGKGRAYGLELYARKKTGKLTGWISYTLSKTEKQINGINNNEWYAARQDRTHDISIVGNYEISPKWSLSAVWVYNTGNAVTFPSGKYMLDNQVVFLYTERNGYRMPAYHRLDLGATLKLKSRKHYSSELNFSLYNAYGRQNPYNITFKQSTTDPNVTVAEQTSLFRWVPAVSWNFKFK